MFLSYAMRKAFQTSVLLFFVIVVAAGCGGGEDESLTPPMPPVSPGGGNGDGGNGGGERPADEASSLLPSASLDRLLSALSKRYDSRTTSSYVGVRYYNPQADAVSHSVTYGTLKSFADVRLSEDGLGNLSVVLAREALGHVDGYDLGVAFDLGRPVSRQNGTDALTHGWSNHGPHRVDGQGRWNAVATGWQSTTDYGNWAVMGFYLIDENAGDSADFAVDFSVQAGSFVASPELALDRAGYALPDGGRESALGTVSYEGPTFGMMVESYGSSRNQPQGTIAEAVYKGNASIELTFEAYGEAGVAGTMTSGSISGLSTMGEGRLRLPNGQRLSLPSGTPIRTVVDLLGNTARGRGWRLRSPVTAIAFSSQLDVNNRPQLLGGVYSARDSWDDGSVTHLTGSYLAATEASGLQDELNALVGN